MSEKEYVGGRDVIMGYMSYKTMCLDPEQLAITATQLKENK